MIGEPVNCEFFERIAVEFEYVGILAADDEQRRGPNVVEAFGRRVDPATTRDDRLDVRTASRRGPERGGRAGTRAEVAEREVARLVVFSQPTVTASNRSVSSGISNRFSRDWSSSSVSRSKRSGPSPRDRSASATSLFRGLCRLLSLPCANTTNPGAFAGTRRSPSGSTKPAFDPESGIATTVSEKSPAQFLYLYPDL